VTRPQMLMFTVYCTFSIFAQAQESSTVFFGDEEVEVSEEQANQIREAENEFMFESEEIERQLRKLNDQLAVKRQSFETKKLSFLTPSQADVISARRFQSGEAQLREQQANDIQHLRELLPILEKLQTRKSITVLEGPQRKGTELPTVSADDQSVEHVGGHFFFKEPLVLNREDELSILSIASSYTSFRPFGGPKLCGGFHPDANIRVATQHGTVQILVCFGCGEALFIDGENRALVEIERDAKQTLHTVCLRNFRQRTPTFWGK
jgi:hypothetical protein